MIHIAFSADEKFVPHMGVAMTSILVNSSESEELFFHVISDSISARSYEKIVSLREIRDFELEIVDAGEKIRGMIAEKIKIARSCELREPATYFRLFVGSIFPDLERILYLDSDVVVQGSLSPLCETDLELHTIAVVEEPEGSVLPDPFLDTRHYFNSGVMLFNLARWRSTGYEDKCFKVEESILEKIQYADQSLLNHVFRDGDILHLGIEYNYIVCLQNYIRKEHFNGSDFRDPLIIHYAALKPWDLIFDIFSQDSPQHPIFNHYWKYRSISPWRNEPLKGAIKMREIFRYLARHPKDLPLALGLLNKWRKGIYPTF